MFHVCRCRPPTSISRTDNRSRWTRLRAGPRENSVMEFRWVMFMTLWTLLSGPIFCRVVSATRTGPAPAARVAPAPAPPTAWRF